MEIFVDDDTKLTLHGLQQYFIRLQESEKNRKLNDLLDALEFNQVFLLLQIFKGTLYFVLINFVIIISTGGNILFKSRQSTRTE